MHHIRAIRRIATSRVFLSTGLVTSLLYCGMFGDLEAAQSIARTWNERALAAIRVDVAHPPVQARNLFHLSVAMYDAWAAYEPTAIGYVYRGKHTAADTPAAKREAISYAAWRLLKERHAFSRTASATLSADDALMTSLTFDIRNASRDTSTHAGVGNSVYDAVSAWFIDDGANQGAGVPYPFADPPVGYPDYPSSQGGYSYLNPPLTPALAGIDDGNGNTVRDINHWQRLRIENAVDQNGFPLGPIQNCLGAQWLRVRPFALKRPTATEPWLNPGPPPLFGTSTHAQFVKEAVAVLTASSQLDSEDGSLVDISPASSGNNSLDFAGHYGTGELRLYDGRGYASNPATGQPYSPHVVKRGDYARVLAEFWADGPSSETPPGHWNVLANKISDNPLLVKRIAGSGPPLDDLEWDVKLYFALNSALHDAACAAWSLKRYYDGWRPIGAIRYLAMLGQSTDSLLPSYNPNGLPLITNAIELVTLDSVAVGRHPGLTPGKIAVRAWPGPPADPVHNISHVRWIHGESWLPFQRTNFVTPAFPGYVSGHSCFSRAAAELLTAFTGSTFFPGGLAVYTNFPLTIEQGPSEPITLQWATYFDAADEAGLSRIWGGIHPPVDNNVGRRIGSQVGKTAWTLSQKYFDGSIANERTQITLSQRQEPNRCEIRFATVRGMFYMLQSTPNLGIPFSNEWSQPARAVDASMSWLDTTTNSAKFYRVVSSPGP